MCAFGINGNTTVRPGQVALFPGHPLRSDRMPGMLGGGGWDKLANRLSLIKKKN